MNHQPTGTVTFLFTDIEGSTKLWESYPAAMPAAIKRHDDLLQQAVEAQGGYVFKTVGDAICAAFATALAAGPPPDARSGGCAGAGKSYISPSPLKLTFTQPQNLTFIGQVRL